MEGVRIKTEPVTDMDVEPGDFFDMAENNMEYVLNDSSGVDVKCDVEDWVKIEDVADDFDRKTSYNRGNELTFRLLNAWYVPQLDAGLLMGVTREGHGVVVKVKLRHYFYMDRKRPFQDEADLRSFLGALQAHFNRSTDNCFDAMNPYLVDESYMNRENVTDPFKLKEYVGFRSEFLFNEEYEKHLDPYGTGGKRPKICDVFRDMFVVEEYYNEETCRMAKRKKCRILTEKTTMAYYTAPDDKLVLGKVWVSKAWQAIQFAAYAESEQYEQFARNQMNAYKRSKGIPTEEKSPYFDEDYFLRLFECTEPITMQLTDHNIHIGKWCTVKNYVDIDRICYRAYNIEADLRDITCDPDNEELCAINILSYDLETAAGATEFSTNPSAFPVAFEGLLPSCAFKNNRYPPIYSTTIARKLASLQSSGVKTNSREFLQKTDPITIIGTIRKREGVHINLDYMESKIFVYKHANADQTASLERWLKKVENKIRACVPKFKQEFEAHETCGGGKVSEVVQMALNQTMSNAGHDKNRNNRVDIGWVYDKIEIYEYDDEIEMIKSFLDYLHASDVDILSGWNTRYFDARYIYERWIYHQHILRRTLPEFNMTCWIHGISKLGIVKDNIVLNYDLYVDNDGILIWKANKEPTPHKLNVVSNKILKLPISIGNLAICLAYDEVQKPQQKDDRKFNVGEEDEDEIFSEDETTTFDDIVNSYRFLCDKTTDELNAYMVPYLFELMKIANDKNYAAKTKFLWASNDDELNEGDDADEFKFRMRKIDFEHKYGAPIWKSGGINMLFEVMYNFVDCLLPLCNISSKGKFVAQLNFAVVTGANYNDVYSSGQLKKVFTAMRKQCKLRHRPTPTEHSDPDGGDFTGQFVYHERGRKHYHYPLVFRGPGTCDENVRKPYNEYRLLMNVRKREYAKSQELAKLLTIEEKVAKTKSWKSPIKPSKYAFKKKKNVPEADPIEHITAGLRNVNIDKGYADSDDDDDRHDIVSGGDLTNFYDDFKANPRNADDVIDMDDIIFNKKNMSLVDECIGIHSSAHHNLKHIDASQIIMSDELGEHDYGNLMTYGPGIIDASSNQGGRVLVPFEPGVKDEKVVTTDAASMYPSKMVSDKTASETFTTEAYTKAFKIPQYEILTTTLGSHYLNAAGDVHVDESAAIYVGSETPCVKKTHFLQNAKCVVPDVINDNFAERDNGKQNKSLWITANNILKANEKNFLDFKCNPSKILTGLVSDNPFLLGKFDMSLEKLKTLNLVANNDKEHDAFFRDQYNNSVDAWIDKLLSFKNEFKDMRKITAVINVVKCFHSLQTVADAKSSANLWTDNYEQYQLEVKCLMNSLYGIMMMTYGPLSLFEISATVTAGCRWLISNVQCISERLTTTFTKKAFSAYDNPWSNNPSGNKNAERSNEMPKPLNGKVPFPFVETELRKLKGIGKLGRLLSDCTVDLYVEIFKAYEALVAFYGDSVTGDTTVIIRSCGSDSLVETKRVDELVNDPVSWVKRDDVEHEYGKEYYEPENLMIWNDTGFTKVKKIIRHLCDKPVVRVLTHTGVVDCTEDHSLVRSNMVKVSPNDLRPGDSLLHIHSNPISIERDIINDGIDIKKSYVMGAFLSEGHCNRNADGHRWVIYNNNIGYLQRIQKYLSFSLSSTIIENDEIDAGTLGVYALILTGDRAVDACNEYRNTFYNEHGEKKIPSTILNANLKVVQRFMKGFFGGKKSSDANFRPLCSVIGSRSIEASGKELCTGLWIIARRLGYTPTITFDIKKPNVFRIFFHESYPQPTNSDHVKNIYSTSYAKGEDDNYIYVYDFETENHHFHVGPGDMVVHNTDSIMLGLKRHHIVNFDQAFDAMKQLTDVINEYLYSRLSFAPEKISDRMIVTSKQKMYDMMAFLDRKKPMDNEWYFKGSDKSDIIPFLAVFIAKCKKLIFTKLREGFPLEDVLSIVILKTQKILLKFSTGQIPLSFLAVSKKLNKYTVGGTSQHNVVADKMIKRGEQVVPGDLITFLKTIETVKAEKGKNKGKTVLVASVEDLTYVLENINDVTIDYKGIFEKKIKNHLLAFLSSVYSSIQDIPHAQSSFSSVRSFKADMVTRNITLIENYLSAMLFYGPSGIMTRFDMRNRILLDNARITKCEGGRVRVRECKYCFNFYRDETFVHDGILSRITSEGHAKRLSTLCPDCVSNGEFYIDKLERKLQKYTKAYLTQRSICLACIEAPMSPKPTLELFEITPEACRFDQCPTHVKRSEITNKTGRLDMLLYSFKSYMLYEKYVKHLIVADEDRKVQPKRRRVEIEYEKETITKSSTYDLEEHIDDKPQPREKITINISNDDKTLLTTDYYESMKDW